MNRITGRAINFHIHGISALAQILTLDYMSIPMSR